MSKKNKDKLQEKVVEEVKVEEVKKEVKPKKPKLSLTLTENRKFNIAEVIVLNKVKKAKKVVILNKGIGDVFITYNGEKSRLSTGDKLEYKDCRELRAHSFSRPTITVEYYS